MGTAPGAYRVRLEGGGAWATAEVQVERFLPEFPRRYEVRWYPDGSRAVVAWDAGPSRCGLRGKNAEAS